MSPCRLLTLSTKSSFTSAMKGDSVLNFSIPKLIPYCSAHSTGKSKYLTKGTKMSSEYAPLSTASLFSQHLMTAGFILPFWSSGHSPASSVLQSPGSHCWSSWWHVRKPSSFSFPPAQPHMFVGFFPLARDFCLSETLSPASFQIWPESPVQEKLTSNSQLYTEKVFSVVLFQLVLLISTGAR